MGTFQNSIDAKNRIAVPARFRDELGTKCVLTKGLDDNLILYPLKTWEAQQEKLAELPRSDSKVRAFLRYMNANAVECEMDKQGRTVLPAYLRESAGITKELVTIGMIDRVEIWSREVYETSENGGMLTQEDFASFSKSYQV